MGSEDKNGFRGVKTGSKEKIWVLRSKDKLKE